MNGDDQGINLRDWFAGQAMRAILTFPNTSNGDFDRHVKDVAESGYAYADAMMAARNRNPDDPIAPFAGS
jgi:hypothetical protein